MWRRTELDLIESPRPDPPESGILLSVGESAEIEARHTFIALVRSLPARQAQVMAWTYDGYQPTEIAALLGLEPATVRSALRAARATLRSKYPREEEAL